MANMQFNKFRTDVWLNYASLALLALSGLIINVVILRAYGTTALGQFNLVYAFYIILSQFSALGIHYSVLRSLALSENQNLEMCRKIISSALLLVLLISIALWMLLKFMAPIMSYFYHDEIMITGILNLGVVLPLFSLNKVILSALNGLRQMGLFAFGQACRYLLMLCYIVVIAFAKLDLTYLMQVFYFAELGLLLILFPVIFVIFLKKKMVMDYPWLVYHFKFGVAAFLSGVFIEINSRIDVIILAVFVNASLVGIYSFAAMLAEGLAMLLVVLRNNVNPILTQLLHDKQYLKLYEFMLPIRKYTYILFGASLAIILIAYLLFINLYPVSLPISQSFNVLFIISMCLFLVAGYLPFADFLILANQPRLQSAQNLGVVLANILLSFMLIPKYGIVGAALAAGLSSYVIAILLIELFARTAGLKFLIWQKLKLSTADD